MDGIHIHEDDRCFEEVEELGAELCYSCEEGFENRMVDLDSCVGTVHAGAAA